MAGAADGPTDGPVLEDDLSMVTDEYSLGGGYEDDDY